MSKYKVLKEMACPYIKDHKPDGFIRHRCYQCNNKGVYFERVDLEKAIIDIIKSNPAIIPCGEVQRYGNNYGK